MATAASSGVEGSGARQGHAVRVIRTWAKWEVLSFPSSLPGGFKTKGNEGGHKIIKGHLMRKPLEQSPLLALPNAGLG